MKTISTYDDLQPQANDSAVLNYTEAEQARTDALAMNPNVKITTGNGRTYMTVSETQPLDVDTDLADHNVQTADAINRAFAFERESALADADERYGQMTPTEQRIAVERKYLPLIQGLSHAHRESCDSVEDFQQDELAYKARLSGNWAHEGKHPHVRKLIVNGDHHFQHLLTSGAFSDGGYKLVDKRGSTAICIPSDVNSLLDYAKSPECLAFVDNEYQREIARLIQKRDRASLQLVTVQREAEQAWSRITDITDFFSKVKRAKSKD